MFPKVLSHSLRLHEGLRLTQQKGSSHTLNKTDIVRKSFPFNAAINSHRILCGCQQSQRVLHLTAGPFCMSWPGMGGLCTLGQNLKKSLPVEHELNPLFTPRRSQAQRTPHISKLASQGRRSGSASRKSGSGNSPRLAQAAFLQVSIGCRETLLPDSVSFQPLSDRQSGLKAAVGEKD